MGKKLVKYNIIKNKEGLTLIELLVIIIIIAILVLLAIPKFLNYIEQARLTQIKNDTKVVENLILIESILEKKEFPSDVYLEPLDEYELKKLLEEAKIYNKYGQINKDGSYYEKNSKEEDKSKQVIFHSRNISYGDSIDDKLRKNVSFGEVDYFLIDKAYLIRKIGTKLKGDFIINKDMESIYVNDTYFTEDINDNNIQSDEEIFDYLIDLDKKGEKTAKIVGFNDEIHIDYTGRDINKGFTIEEYDKNNKKHKKWIKFLEENKTEENPRPFPDIPEYYEKDGNRYPITRIKEESFKDIVFTQKDFNGPNIEEIGKGAFIESVFKGKFNVPKLKNIGNGAFAFSEFEGELYLPNLEEVGNEAFWNSSFEGRFNALNIKIIEFDAFYKSKFTGDFYAPNIRKIGSGAFRTSDFNGSFYAPSILIIGNSEFGYFARIFGDNTKFLEYNPKNPDMIKAIENDKFWTLDKGIIEPD